jgi:hypothetical protein
VGRRRLIDDANLIEKYKQGKSLKEIGKENNPPVSHIAVFNRAKSLGLSRLPKSVESLTEKERNFCLAVVGGKSRINAVMETYDVTSRGSAKALQQTLMKNPAIKASISDLMEARGIGKVFRVEKLAEHLNSRDEMISLKSLDMACKLADDAGERTKGTPEGLSFTKFDINLLKTDD